MKLNKMILPVVASAMLLAGCDDQIMEWGTPDGHTGVTQAEIPLAVKEVLANYDVIKAYSAENHPNMKLGLGVGKDIYMGTDGRHELAAGNFQMVTWGNAMKHDAMVGNTGALNFTNLDPALETIAADGIGLWGHNFFWHTQQNQTYLKSVIKPTLVVESDSDIKNMLAGDASDFDGGTTGGWGSWGSNKDNVEVLSGAGPDGSAAAVLTNKGDGNFWEAQFAYTFDTPLSKDVEYTIRFKAKSTTAAGQLQFQYQNGKSYGSQGGYNTFDVGTGWATYEYSFTITDYDDVDRIILNFGKVGGSYTIDNIEFGEKQDNPMDYLVMSDFEDGTTGGWGSWGSNKEDAAVVDGQGVGGSKALMLKNKGDGNFWEAQNAYTFDAPLQQGVEYTIRFKAKSTSSAGQLQFQYQNGKSYGSQGGYNTFDVGTSWTPCEYSFTITDYDDVNRIILNFGKVGATYYVDDIEFGTMKATDPMDNILVGGDSDFESDHKWGSWGSNKDNAEVVAGAGHNGTAGLVLTNKGDGNAWEAQFAYTFEDPLLIGKKYIIQFYAKSSSAAGELQFQYQNGSTYGEQGGYNTFEVGTDWTLCESEFTIDDPEKTGVTRIILNFGKVGATYYVDDIKFGLAKDQSAAAARQRAARRAAKSYYVLKSADEKREALLGAMESWVKGMAEHLADKGIVPVGYDVINEAITDGEKKVRGVDGVFGGSWTEDDQTYYDAAPTENEQDGLELNWGSGHFYWGYYVPDYAVKAFEYARQYLPAETKLFYNDYNLETSDAKRAAAIKFVQDIDQAHGSAIVDGIGTQMHITLSGTSDDAENNAAKVAALRAQVDKQFQELAATGKLVRITELDISLGSSSPSAAQYKAQSDAYKTIFESYFQNVPEAQQSGITIWSLTDADDEHEYWLKGEKPNLFDASFLRKWAYKGVCDALAGEDLGLKLGGEAYKAYYERQNVSSTVE
ncbi:MAG: endo-1,4-beta-xylanase [Prevotella sp.]|nr:endo-1,4-beta-xylanase [Prevotella sp.]